MPTISLIADHFLQSREDHRDIKGLGSNNLNLVLLGMFVGQKLSKKQNNRALQNLSALDHQHDLISHHYREKTAHTIVAAQQNGKGYT